MSQIREILPAFVKSVTSFAEQVSGRQRPTSMLMPPPCKKKKNAWYTSLDHHMLHFKCPYWNQWIDVR